MLIKGVDVRRVVDSSYEHTICFFFFGYTFGEPRHGHQFDTAALVV